MALRDFLFGFKFLATDYVSPVLKNIEGRIEAVNAQVKNTARWREAGTNLAIAGGAFAAAGAAVGFALKSTVDAAADMQSTMTHVATAMNDGAASAAHLEQAQEMSEKLAIASGLAAKQEASAYYIARSNMLDHAQAMAAVDVATKLTIGTTASLADAQSQLEPTTRLLTTVYQNFGNKALDVNKQVSGFADTMAKLQTQYAFKGIDEVNFAMQYAVPLAKAAGISFNQMAASLALLSESGLHGAEAGTAFSELVTKMNAGGKLRSFVALNNRGGIDLAKTMEKLRAATAGMAPYQEALWLKQVGFTERSMRGVSLLIDKTGQYRSTINDLNNAQGANAAAFATRQASMEIATGRLSAAWDVFKSKIGEQLLGPLTGITSKLTTMVSWMTALVTAHPLVTKYIVTFAAIAAAMAVVVGGAIALVGGLMAMASFIGIGGGVLALIAGIGVAVSAVAAAVMMWWPQIKSFFSNWGGVMIALTGPLGEVVKLVWNFGPAMFSAGANMLAALAKGIWSNITAPVRAIESVASKIMSYWPRSPAREGPLRNLNRIRIVETIAESIRPGPALAAIRRTAAAVAIAAPMTFAPMMAGPAFAGAPGGAGGGAAPIVINYSPNIYLPPGANAQAWLAVARQHARELKAIIEGRTTHEGRREF